MEETTNPLGESDAVDAIASLLDGPDDREPEIEEEEAAEEPQEEAAPDGEAEAEPEEEAAEPEEEEEISWNGETKKLSKTELKELASKGFDYTQKTQQLADQRREFEAQAKQMQQSIAVQNANIETVATLKNLDAQLAQFKEVNWHALAESDPVQYLKLNQSFRDLKDTREETLNTFHQQANYLQQMNSHQQAETLAKESKALQEALPEFRGEKAKESQAKVREYLLANGYKTEELANVTDHRAVALAWKAQQWDALQKSKPALTKRVAETPKVLKSGTPKAQAPQASKDAYASLRKTGRGEYAAKLIESMI